MVFYKKAVTEVTAFSYEVYGYCLIYCVTAVKTDTTDTPAVSAFTVMGAEVQAAAKQWQED